MSGKVKYLLNSWQTYHCITTQRGLSIYKIANFPETLDHIPSKGATYEANTRPHFTCVFLILLVVCRKAGHEILPSGHGKVFENPREKFMATLGNLNK